MSIGDEHLIELGRLTVNFSSLEFLAAFAIWRLGDLEPKVGLIVTDQLSARRLFETVADLAEVRLDASRAQQVRSLMKQADALREKRNRVMHAAWSLPEGEGSVGTLRLRRKGVVSTDVHPAALAKLSEELREVKERLVQALKPLWPTEDEPLILPTLE